METTFLVLERLVTVVAVIGIGVYGHRQVRRSQLEVERRLRMLVGQRNVIVGRTNVIRVEGEVESVNDVDVTIVGRGGCRAVPLFAIHSIQNRSDQ